MTRAQTGAGTARQVWLPASGPTSIRPDGDEPPPRRRRKRLGRGFSIGISIAIHLLVLLGGLWLPGPSLVPLAEPEADRELEPELLLTFAPHTDREIEERVSGQVPRPLPEVPPALAPSAPVPPSLEPPSEPAPRSVAIPRADPKPHVPERSEDVGRAAHSGRTEGRADEGRPVAPGQRGTPAESDEDSHDVAEALREYGRRLARASPLPAGTGGHGTSNVFRPDYTAVPQTGYGVGNLTFESTDYDWDDYGQQVYWAIWRAWHNRLLDTVTDFETWAQTTRHWRLDHRTRVRFVIEHSGEVTEIAVEAASGSPPLDVSATDALAEVVLPPLPADFPREREVVHAHFLAQGPIYEVVGRARVCPPGSDHCAWVDSPDGLRQTLRSTMRDSLESYKRAGLF